MDLLNKILRGSLVNLLFKILSVVAAFLVAKMFINNYGEDEYAIWLLNLAIISYFGLVINGVPGGVLKYFAQNEIDNKPKNNVLLFYDALLLYVIAGFLSFVIILVYAESIVDVFNVSQTAHWNLVRMLRYSAILLVFIWPLYVAENIFQALMRYDLINLFKSSGLVVGALLLLLFISVGAKIVYLPIAYYLPQLVAMFLLNLRLRKVLDFGSGYRFQIKRFKTLVLFVAPLILVELSSVLSYEGEKLFIANRLDMKSLAEYSVVTLVPLNIRAFYGVLTVSVLPAVFKLSYAKDEEGVERILEKGSTYLFVFLSPLILAVILLSEDLLGFFVSDNESYLTYESYFDLLCVALLVLLPYSAFVSRVLIGMSRIRFILYFTIALNVVKLGLIYFLAEDYGLEGVFIISLCLSVIGGILMLFYAIQTININWATLLKRAVANLLVFAVVWILAELLLENFVVNRMLQYVFIFMVVLIYFTAQINRQFPLKSLIKMVLK